MLMRARPETVLRKRLLPLHAATFLQGFMLWVPVEKLFMNEIGFDGASVGLLAATYAAVVPIVEVPSGILADRWSRRNLLIVASIALMLCSLIGGMSHNVPMYMASALVLGVYFAMYSGTVDAIVYDTVLEETGDGEAFQERIGRVRLIESAALVSSSLAGGWLASLTSPRLMYFLTVPFTALSIVAYLHFAEPGLHKAGERTSVRSQVAATYQAIALRGRLVPIIVLTVLTSLSLQVIFEFGPLWLVALAASAALYGPYWAGLTATLGLGGLLAGRLRLDRPVTLGAVVLLMILASLVLTTTTGVVLVTIAQMTLALLVMTASIHVSSLLHDAVPSAVRAGVVSAVSAVSWIVFLPFALVFGLVTKVHGVQTAGWLLTAVTVLAGLLLAKVTLSERRAPAAAVPAAALGGTPVVMTPCTACGAA